MVVDGVFGRRDEKGGSTLLFRVDSFAAAIVFFWDLYGAER